MHSARQPTGASAPSSSRTSRTRRRTRSAPYSSSSGSSCVVCPPPCLALHVADAVVVPRAALDVRHATEHTQGPIHVAQREAWLGKEVRGSTCLLSSPFRLFPFSLLCLLLYPPLLPSGFLLPSCSALSPPSSFPSFLSSPFSVVRLRSCLADYTVCHGLQAAEPRAGRVSVLPMSCGLFPFLFLLLLLSLSLSLPLSVLILVSGLCSRVCLMSL